MNKLIAINLSFKIALFNPCTVINLRFSIRRVKRLENVMVCLGKLIPLMVQYKSYKTVDLMHTRNLEFNYLAVAMYCSVLFSSLLCGVGQ